ncbi:ead/Ea22-like family protein [Klebsiella pneumoniae]|uniref:ead/Ea22-like family protein n=1 Tax=Klebsiella pneumoniae TaxID=573 RepID=UPI0009BB19EC|nr:ead/Ea22-like family protein [Klebsiella pneumoniae]SLR80136.1 RelE family toxin-antitoxin system [Klebsiella pneumoniae]
MTDITELAQSLKAAAEKATPGPWALARDRKTVVSNQSHPIANLSDAMHRMLADGTTGQDAEFISLANPANVLALVEALEKAQQQMTESENRVRKQNRHICELFDDNTALRQRIAELESRTVKLPDLRQIVSGDRYVWSDGVYNYSQDVKVVLAAAGIKVEDE